MYNFKFYFYSYKKKTFKLQKGALKGEYCLEYIRLLVDAPCVYESMRAGDNKIQTFCSRYMRPGRCASLSEVCVLTLIWM